MSLKTKKFNKEEPHRNAPRVVWCKNKCMWKLNNCYKINASILKKKAWKRNALKRTLALLKKVEYYHEFLRDYPGAVVLNDVGETDLAKSFENVDNIISDFRNLYLEQNIPIPDDFPEKLKQLDRENNKAASIRKALLSW